MSVLRHDFVATESSQFLHFGSIDQEVHRARLYLFFYVVSKEDIFCAYQLLARIT